MISEATYEKIKSQILERVSHDLSKDLFYHGIHHTLDVLEQAERIAKEEKISHKDELLLLKVACLYHDIGFLVTYNGHEEAGCKMAKDELPAFGFTDQQIDIICGMIMATKIPQTPHSKLEEIICDADLDYLGRPDFFTISNTLFNEIKERGWVADEREWNLIQVKFIKTHSYFTSTDKRLREQQKHKYLEILEAKIQVNY
jgi:uncharacterized protein